VHLGEAGALKQSRCIGEQLAGWARH